MATFVVAALLGGMLAGCQSHHLNSQLLERELRLQEDQIYRLQDVLDEKSARLESVVQENASLKRQLGYGGTEPVSSRTTPPGSRSPGGAGSSGPAFVPPTIELSDPAPPSTLPPPPMLEGVPPLPQSSPAGSGAGGGEAPPAASLLPEGGPPAIEASGPAVVPPSPMDEDAVDAADEGPSFAPAFGSPQAAAPGLLDEAAQQASALQRPMPSAGEPIQQLSFVEPAEPEAVAVSPPPVDASMARIVINRDETRITDTDGDGVADALSVVFEPRDLEERLINGAGDVAIEVHPAAATAGARPVASWSVSAADAAATFRSTSRSRGIRLLLPWQNGPQPGFAGLARVRVRTPSGSMLEAEAPISLP